MKRVILAAIAASAPAFAQAPVQAPNGPSQAGIDEAVRLGTIATLAHICGLRAENWAFDLRRAMILDTTHTTQPDDKSLQDAPGSQLITTAMTYAETEALEDFAEAAPAVTCTRLKNNPELLRADRIVQSFRTLKATMKPTS